MIGAGSPPLNGVFVVHGKVDLFIGPVNNCFFGTDAASEQFLLSFSVVNRQSFVIRNVVFFHVLFDVWPLVPAFLNDLVTSKMNKLIIKS